MAKNRENGPTPPSRRDEWLKYALMGMALRPYPPKPDLAVRMAIEWADAVEAALNEPSPPVADESVKE